MDQIEISGPYTEALVSFIANEVDDITLNDVEIRRIFAPSTGTANEPITTYALITISGTAIVVVGRLIERWLELNASDRLAQLVLRAYEHSHEAGKAMARIARDGLKVSSERKPLDIDEIWKNQT